MFIPQQDDQPEDMAAVKVLGYEVNEIHPEVIEVSDIPECIVELDEQILALAEMIEAMRNA